MATGMEDFRKFDNLIEPVVVIDLESESIIYYNQVCYYLELITEDMPISKLSQLDKNDKVGKVIRESALLYKEPCTIENVSINTPEAVRLTGTLLIDSVNAEWTQIYLMLQFDANEFYTSRQEKKDLESQIYTDGLTGCWTKMGFQSMVETIFKKANVEESHTLLIIDIDNFKVINDNLGHHFGDVVLKEAGMNLRELFRGSDCVGRIGGDEFMVLLKSVGNKSIVEDKVKKILEKFDRIYEGHARSYRTTASIGIAKYPEDGTDFETLYKRADVALYDTKSRGKNGYTFYNATMVEGTMSNTTPFDAATRALEKYYDQSLIANIFTLLTDVKDYKITIRKVLELLAVRFDADRCYILETKREKEQGDKQQEEILSMTFEWCGNGSKPQIDLYQNISRATLQPALDMANKEGILYCNDVKALREETTQDVIQDRSIQSILLSINEGQSGIATIMGFDDCHATRVWSAIEISTLMHASKIMTQFLKYSYAISGLNKVIEENVTALDEIYSFVYVVDIEQYELQYVNGVFREKFPKAKLGEKCYQVLHDYHTVCPGCPVTQMERQNKGKFRSVMKMKVSGQEVLVNASRLESFGGKQCVFFSATSTEEIDTKIAEES